MHVCQSRLALRGVYVDQVIPVLIVVAFLGGWWWFLYKRSGGRLWSPLWIAVSATAAAALFIVAGALGYTLNRHERFADGTAWSDTVIWWEVGVGLLLVPLAAYFWRKGFHTLRLGSLAALAIHSEVPSARSR